MSEIPVPVEVPGVYFNHLSVSVQEAAGLATIHVVKEKGGFASATVRIADLLSALGNEDTTEAEVPLADWERELLAGVADAPPRPKAGELYRLAEDPRWGAEHLECSFIKDGTVVRVIHDEPDWRGYIVVGARGEQQVVQPRHLEPVGEPRVGDRVRALPSIAKDSAPLDRVGATGVVRGDLGAAPYPLDVKWDDDYGASVVRRTEVQVIP